MIRFTSCSKCLACICCAALQLNQAVLFAGSILVKRTAWSMLFLQHLYNEYNIATQTGSLGQEQGAINRYAQEHFEQFRRHAGIVNRSVFNQHRYEHYSHSILGASILYKLVVTAADPASACHAASHCFCCSPDDHMHPVPSSCDVSMHA